MAGPIELVKAHPVIAVGGVIGVIVIVMLVSGGGASASSGSVDTGGAVDPMAAINAQLAAHTADVQAQRDVALNTNAINLQVAQLNQTTALQTLTTQQAVREAELHTQEVISQTNASAQMHIVDDQTAIERTRIGAQAAAAHDTAATQQLIARQQGDVAKAQIGAQQQNGIFGFLGGLLKIFF